MWNGSLSENVRFGLLLGLLAVLFLMGGASRLDVTSLILLQPIAAACAIVVLLIASPIDWPSVRAPLLFLGSLAGLMAAQLIPLPPSVWTKLAGHAPFAQTAAVAGLAQPWRPMSLTPDLTLASLVGLVVPAAVLIAFAGIGRAQRRVLLVALLLGTAASAVFALGQISGGDQSPAYTYSITNFGSAVGLFANRNHQAALIAMAWPMLAVWATLPRRDPRQRAATRWIGGGFALFLLPLLLVTGSRSGLVLGVIGLACAAFIMRLRGHSADRAQGASNRLFTIAIALGAVLLIAASIVLSRAQAVLRVLALDMGDDTRTQALPTLLKIVWDFFPVGSGFGSFDPVYRFYEPLELLDTEYLNHAHNDLLELVMTAGLPGALLLALFLIWFVRQSFKAWRTQEFGDDRAVARAGSVIVFIALLSSLVDYPLRTPLMMAIFAIACGWLADIGRGDRSRPNVV